MTQFDIDSEAWHLGCMHDNKKKSLFSIDTYHIANPVNGQHHEEISYGNSENT